VIRQFSETTDDELKGMLEELAKSAKALLDREGVSEKDQVLTYSADLRYFGQGFEIPVAVDISKFDGKGGGLEALSKAFDAEHQQLFSFLLDAEYELVTIRATANGPRPAVKAPKLTDGGPDSSHAVNGKTEVYVEGKMVEAKTYDRLLLKAGNVVVGPAIVTEMDSTTLVLKGHEATVHPSGSLLIEPTK